MRLKRPDYLFNERTVRVLEQVNSARKPFHDRSPLPTNRVQCHVVLTVLFTSAINSSITARGISKLNVSTENCPDASQNNIRATRFRLPARVRYSSRPAIPWLLSSTN